MFENANEQPKILVVDDEEKILTIVKSFLEQEGYIILTASSGQQALSIFQNHSDLSLVLLDWLMPKMNGLEVFHRLREFSEIPVIFLTAKSEEVDKLLGLEIGADDYITKPFSVRELASRIRVVLRRIEKFQRNQKINEPGQERINRGRIVIDTARYAVYVDGKETILTPTEFKLLYTLASMPGRVFSRLQLLEIALGEEYAGYERSIDTHISNLRKKVEFDPAAPAMILTVFGIGYKFGENV